jgi:DNA polymerase-3 subunit epsilon
MLLARRLYPASPDHKLGTLVRYLSLSDTARHHRALADAEMTAHLWSKMDADILRQYGLKAVSHDLMCALQKVPKAKLSAFFEKQR